MLARIETPEGVVAYRSPRLAELGVPHAFTTRYGRRATPPLDLGHIDRERAAALASAIGLRPRSIERVRQVHGCGVVRATAEPLEPTVEADALVTSTPETALLVRVADCVPVLVASRDGARVAAIHAGWRGLVSGVIPAAVAALNSQGFVAAVGPCLSLARFEVGPEVAEAFRAAELPQVIDESLAERPHADLRRAATIQLNRCGASAIDVSEHCTWDDRDFFSHRRDVTHGGASTTGRQGAVIACRATSTTP